ncbi:tRNA uridine-5-carboxymethylaminomethyl(34) synthesis GTPase MnmE [Legionella sp. W05-934-2]|jgi:tRNA modification GTPase|uniref:tRNA uridine-5-carboxymethylaminomethyl(34) synthesis GTPase MnmE n=1 Tax=Legionella sp. W05-934-2 TaxID=1198649 RepID=UPI0034630680
MSDDTIVACATPPGQGGVGILRISGPKTLSLIKALTRRQQFKPRYATYIHIYDLDDNTLDSGIGIYFPGPHSFTGEDVFELQLHGSPIMLDAIIKKITEEGARLAQPGEFSLRAFLNNKIDLIQAEAIADLIAAQSLTSAKMAGQSLQGNFSRRINELNERIIHLRMYVEAAIDFPEEEIDFISEGHVAEQLDSIIEQVRIIISQAGQGVMMREGVTIVIAGQPNVGKSTLINALAEKEVAIVTDIAGTTRDVMREYILIDDIPVHIIDTAGLRESDDPVEKVGIAKAWQALAQADCLLYLIDINEHDEEHPLTAEIKKKLAKSTPILRVYNKIDTVKLPAKISENTAYISAKKEIGLDALKQKIKQLIGQYDFEGQFMARRRHVDALTQCLQLLVNGKEQLHQHKAGELLADDLTHAHRALSQITGEYHADDLLGEIFSSFCIGK